MSEAATRWIGGRTFDLSLIWGGSVLGVAAGVAMLFSPGLVMPLWWVWLLLCDGPHLAATWVRAYLDPEERARRGRLLSVSLLFLLPGFAVFALSRATGVWLFFDLFLLFATLWSYFHAIRQDYGILAIYQRHAGADAATRRVDSLFLQVGLWSFYLFFMLAHPASRETLRLPVELPLAARLALSAIAALFALANLGYGARIVRRFRAGLEVRPQLFVLLPVMAAQGFALFVVGRAEPLYPHPTNPEQVFLAAAVAGGISHGTQYLGIVFAANRRRFAEGRGGRSLAARLGRVPLLAYGLCVLLSLGYLLLNAARGAGPGFSFFALDSDAARLFLAFYWGLFFHHYWIDQYIWRVQGDRALQLELGLA